LAVKQMNWASDPVLSGGDECGRLLRELDWSKNPLGPPASWPKELRTLVSVMLGSSQPVLIVWGNEQTTLYNDGYAAMCGSRHPAALGNPFSELWFEIWDQVEPILANAYRGIGTRMDDIQFTMFRNGFPEETHFSFSYTPVRNEEGAVLGMFCVCAETTDQVLGRRREEIERDRLKQMFEQAPAVIAMLEGPDHVFAFANRAY
jgi:PAS domain-containing protein